METNKITVWHTIVAVAGITLFVFLFLNSDVKNLSSDNTVNANLTTDIENTVLNESGVVLPIKWGNIGKQMIEKGVIDKEKFEILYEQRGGLNEDDMELLYGENNENVLMNDKNSSILLNLLWAFGLSNKNRILEEGPMVSDEYGGDASRFASTGGWIISKGNPMDYYSKYNFIALTKEQQELVERVSKNIYRPCCGNSTYFPDCNHGMAMLGLLELLGSEGVSEEDMYKIALSVNSYWFPDTYITLARYFSQSGIDWKDVDPKKVLGAEYSSAQGYMKILEEIKPAQIQKGAGCSV